MLTISRESVVGRKIEHSKMTRILLTNYPRIYQEPEFQKVSGDSKNERIRIISGYDVNVDKYEVTLQIARDLIMGILTYDEVLIKASNVYDVIQVWGSTYIKELLRDHILRVIPDQELNPVIKYENQRWNPSFFGFSSGISDEKGNIIFSSNDKDWAGVETQFYRVGFVGLEANSVLELLDENKLEVDENEIRGKTLKETIHDMNTSSFVDQYSILRTNDKGQREFHKQRLGRLHELNMTTVLSASLGVESVKTDGNISQLMSYKLSSSVLMKQFPDGISAFKTITASKGFPDLGALFYNKIINLDDILKLRNDYQGKIFRYWNKLDNYEEKELQKDVMNSIHNVLGNRLSNALRMLTTNVIGIFGFLPGVIASCIDSYIIGKIAQGWHPNFFLDDKLKSLIDKNIEKHEREERAKIIMERFKGVRPNDPCPCGSGKKFKKCHGRFI